MKHEILKSYLSSADIKFYNKLNLGWEATKDCLRITLDDGKVAGTYVIFKGGHTLQNMCRDCGQYYELPLGSHVYKFPKR